MSQQTRRLAVLSAVALTTVSGTAMAEQAIEEVIVTAQKREQSLQDVPISVSAFNEEMMRKANIEDVRGLTDLTPGFSGRTEDSFNDALSIRGISTNDFGIGGDPSVGIFMDGVYEGRTGGAITSFFDIASAEVVKGPQGTLFGRNAIAGAISMRTNKPDEEFGGSIGIGLEQYSHREITGILNVPLSDRWFLRMGAHTFQDDGYLTNLAGGPALGKHDRDAARVALRYAGDTIDATATVFYEERQSSGSVYWDTSAGTDRGVQGSVPLLPNEVNTDLGDGTVDQGEILRMTLELEADLSGGYTLTSITGYKTFDYFYKEDYDASPLQVDDYVQDNKVDYVSQEFRLSSPTDGNIFWFVGASAYSEEIEGRFDNRYTEDHLCQRISETDAEDFSGPVDPALGCADPNFAEYWEVDPADLVGGLTDKSETNYANGDYMGYAVYADVSWTPVDWFDLTFGARYTFDEKEFKNRVLDSGGVLGNNFNFEFYTDGFISDKRNWSDFTPRLAATFHVNEDLTLYGNVAKGYKSGGFATFGFNLVDDDEDGIADPGTTLKTFEPEEVLSFELGAKYRSPGRSLQSNISFYTYEYTDLQLVFFANGSSQVDNVAEASGMGAELDTRWYPTEAFDLYWGFGWSDSEIDNVDQSFLDEGGCDNCAGNRLWFQPEITSSLIATYHVPLSDSSELYFTLEHQYEDEKYAGPDNLEVAKTPSYSSVNFRLGYDAAKWSAVAYIENLTDELWYERGWENAGADNDFGYGLVNTLVWPSRGRTFGVKMNYSF